MRELAANVLVVALSAGLLWHFGLIVKYKQVLFQEPNTLILSLEVVMFTGFIVFAIFNIIKLVRSK